MKVKLKKEQCQLPVVRRSSVTWSLSRTKLREELTNPQFSVCGGAVVHEMGMVPQRICGTAALERGAEGEPQSTEAWLGRLCHLQLTPVLPEKQGRFCLADA